MTQNTAITPEGFSSTKLREVLDDKGGVAPPQNKHGSPENGGPLEKEIPIGNHHFQVPC